MSNSAKEAIEKALTKTRNWAAEGWPMQFGSRDISANNQNEARNLSDKFSNKLEAVAYWRNVADSARLIVDWGEKAKKALEKNDLKDAADCVYFAVIMEKGIHESTPTWGPVYQSLIKN